MITAVDTSVLLDVFLGDPQHVRQSANALRGAISQGRLVACEVVWAEVESVFPEPGAAGGAMDTLGVEFGPLSLLAAERAGRLWRAYRQAGGSRQRVVADFLIGAHAFEQAERLLTRDRGFYRRYFGDLAILDPSSR